MPATTRTLREKLWERWAGLRISHEAVMMEDARAALAAERARTNRVDPSKPPKEEQMGDLHVGDVYHEAPKPALAGTLAKLALGGAILGAGAAIPLLLDAFADKTPSVVEQSERVDQDTRYRLEFGTPKPKANDR